MPPDHAQTVRRGIRPWAEEHRTRHDEAFAKVWALVERGYHTLVRLEVHVESLREVVISTLWVRCLEHAEATLVLLEQGLLAPAQVSLRALTEALFTIRAVANHDDMLKAFLAEDDHHRRKLWGKAKRTSDPRFQSHATPELEAELKAAATASGARELQTQEWADRAGLTDWYLVVYALLTGPAHTKIRDLQRYLREDPSGGLGFSFEHRDIDVLGVLSTTGISLVLAYDPLDGVFEKGLGEERQGVLDYFMALGNAAGADDVSTGV